MECPYCSWTAYILWPCVWPSASLASWAAGPAHARKIEKSADAYRSIGEAAEELGLQGSMTEVLKFEKPESRKEGERFEGDETETVPMAIQKLVSEAKLAV